MTWLSAGRPDRSTVAEVSRPVRSTDVHRTCTQPGLVDRSTGWSTVQRALLSGNGPVDRPRAAALCIQLLSRSTGQRAVVLWFQARSTGRSTGGTTVTKMTVGRSTGRSIGRFLTFPGCQRAEFVWGYKYPTFELVSYNNLKSKFSHL